MESAMPIGNVTGWILTAALLLSTENAVVFAAATYDSDVDGIGDNLDNCLAVSNSQQRDTDGDGIGNACDADLNDDCTVDINDLEILRGMFFSSNADADFNGDGMVNAIDLGIMKRQFSGEPGPTGTPNLCTCSPPESVDQSTPNSEFNGQEMFLRSGLVQDGAAVPGINNFAYQDNNLYIARIFARSDGTFNYRIADQASSIEYCSDKTLEMYIPMEVPNFKCSTTPGSLQIPMSGCYEVAMRTDGSVLPAMVELTLGERLGHWDIQVDASGHWRRSM
jgi:hypothetical protein